MASVVTVATRAAHSSTEAEVIALDSGTRLDGMPMLLLWEQIIAMHIVHNRARLSKVDGLLRKYDGKERAFLDALKAKYMVKEEIHILYEKRKQLHKIE